MFLVLENCTINKCLGERVGKRVGKLYDKLLDKLLHNKMAKCIAKCMGKVFFNYHRNESKLMPHLGIFNAMSHIPHLMA